MTALGDFELNRTPGLPDEPRRRGWIYALALLAVLIAVGVWFWMRQSGTPSGGTEAPAQETAAPSPTPDLGTAGPIDLPPLGETDPTVRELVGGVSNDPTVASWLTTEGLIRNFTAVVLNVAEGRYPGTLLARFRPSEPFKVVERNGRTVIDPASYARYDHIARAVTSLDPASAARVYGMLKPRLEEAYRELGFPDTSIDQTMEEAIVRLLRTPIPSGDIEVVPKGADQYAFADPKLENLSHAQKLLLRTGPENARRIQAHLRNLALALGIPADRLPSTS